MPEKANFENAISTLSFFTLTSPLFSLFTLAGLKSTLRMSNENYICNLHRNNVNALLVEEDVFVIESPSVILHVFGIEDCSIEMINQLIERCWSMIGMELSSNTLLLFKNFIEQNCKRLNFFSKAHTIMLCRILF